MVWSIRLAGAGHGWVSPTRICWIAILTGPLSCVAWVYRSKPLGVTLALALFVVMLVAGILLPTMTEREGMEYFYRIWPRYSQEVLVWGAMWSVWQVVTIATLLAYVFRDLHE
jgi:hypothetical protein